LNIRCRRPLLLSAKLKLLRSPFGHEFSPRVVIEAKITEDDGTARDKVTRVQQLGEISTQGRQPHAAL
jgi:hypothetical protein